MSPGEKYALRLLGPFGLFTPCGERIEVTSKKAIALIALLASAPDGLRTRNWIQGKLWEDRDTPQAQASLRRELSTLFKVLREHGADHLLDRESQRVRLNLDLIDIDVLNLAPDDMTPQSRQSGDFLEGIDLPGCEEFEDWLRAQRERANKIRAIAIPRHNASRTALNGAADSPDLKPTDILDDAPLSMPPKPSVTVLPFEILPDKNTAEIKWIGVGLAEEIGMTLSQFPQLFVVASGSAATLMERGCTYAEVAQQLGVQYLLGGSLTPLGDKLRVFVSLHDGRTNEHVWSNVVYGKRADLFALQDQVALLAAPQIWTQIDMAERHRSLQDKDRRKGNYERYWRANALFRNWTGESILEAIVLTDELVRETPSCAFAASLAGFCNGIAYAMRLTRDPAATRRAAISHYQNALRFGGNNVEALGYVAGTLVCINGDVQLADRLIDHALVLLPRFQPTLFWGGWVDLVNGNHARARERMELALRINPASGTRSYAIAAIGIAHLLDGDARLAMRLLQRAIIDIPTYPPAQAALFAAAKLTGETDVAASAAAAMKALDIETALSIFNNPEHRELLARAINAEE